MPDRRYIPAAYVDEICPPGRASPNDWIGAPAGDVWLLATEEDLDLGLTLKPGEIVEFDWIEPLGEVLVRIHADGTHAAEGMVPDGVTHFWSGWGENILADSLDEFVSKWRQQVGVEQDSTSVPVAMARWSREPDRFRFDISERGPRFIRASPPREPAQTRGAP